MTEIKSLSPIWNPILHLVTKTIREVTWSHTGYDFLLLQMDEHEKLAIEAGALVSYIQILLVSRKSGIQSYSLNPTLDSRRKKSYAALETDDLLLINHLSLE